MRLYRTGDLGCLLPDGRLLYAGRKDTGVKIRGQDINIAEIEMALLGLADVGEAIVVPRESGDGSQSLVAYLVPGKRPGPDTPALRRALRMTLPDIMIPSAFVLLETLPTMPNGKVDREALPEPQSVRPQLDVPFTAPRTMTEKAVAAIWSEVLDVPEIGVHDNFFDLGGQSLKVFQILSRVFQDFGVEVPLRALFDSPTVADMAMVIIQNRAKQTERADIERMLAEVEALTAEQASQFLEDEGTEI